MWLNFTTCAACLLFLQGLCQCYDEERGGPRATSDCISCKCITMWHAMKKRKKARKYLYHMNNEACGCNVSCKLSGQKRCTKPGSKYDRIAYHSECMDDWVQCAHMKLVSEQLATYSAFLSEERNTAVPIVLEGCCPLIGYEKKLSTMINVKNPSDFVSRRREAIWTLKLQKNHRNSNFCRAWVPQDEINFCDSDAMTTAQIVGQSWKPSVDLEEEALEHQSLKKFLETLKFIENAAVGEDNVSILCKFRLLFLFFFLGCVCYNDTGWQ